MMSYRERWGGLKIKLVMEMITATPLKITVFQIATLLQLMNHEPVFYGRISSLSEHLQWYSNLAISWATKK
jgi:hypothetical protein